MKNTCILCDFDGTITKTDGLYGFFSKFAEASWLEIEKLWEENKINSKECLIREFECIKNLDESLIENYVKEVEIDEYFKEFKNYIEGNDIDLYIVSDGADYFIEKTLKNDDINGISVISNHFEFINEKFKLTFPNENQKCRKDAGTCKCKVIKQMKERYKEVIYIGDGTSDYCAADKADRLFAKGKLIDYCKKNNIDCVEFETFKDILKTLAGN